VPDDDPNTHTPTQPRLLDRVRDAISVRHYSERTEEAYIHWIKRFIYFSGKRHPARNCWGMRASRRRWSTPTSWTRAAEQLRARSTRW